MKRTKRICHACTQRKAKGSSLDRKEMMEPWEQRKHTNQSRIGTKPVGGARQVLTVSARPLKGAWLASGRNSEQSHQRKPDLPQRWKPCPRLWTCFPPDSIPQSHGSAVSVVLPLDLMGPRSASLKMLLAVKSPQTPAHLGCLLVVSDLGIIIFHSLLDLW